MSVENAAARQFVAALYGRVLARICTIAASLIGRDLRADGRWALERSPADSWERSAAAVAIALILVQAQPVYFPLSASSAEPRSEDGAVNNISSSLDATRADNETMLAGYIGIPDHFRSDVRLVRPDGTDLTLKNLRWDAEPFNFPIYAGVRAVHWWGPFGGMIDFLHDKAIARTGRGAHGRKLTGERAIPDTVEATGSLKGSPAPSPVKLTDILERLEFSHGHNMLMPTVLLRLGGFMPRLRPYVGFGAGVAIPHVEVWPAGESDAAKTNEYQAAGPAMQVVFGLEWKGTRGSSFLEYKFTYASLSTALTGGKTPAWCNCDIPATLFVTS